MKLFTDVTGGLSEAAAAAIRAGLAKLGPVDTDVAAASDFVQVVRTLTGDPRYDAARNGGVVAARTIRRSNGQLCIVLNWSVLESAGQLQIERLVAHEAGHALIMTRGEDVWQQTAGVADSLWDHQVRLAASVAVDEYRCEAAVYKAGYGPEESYENPGLQDHIFGLDVQLLAANAAYQEHLDVGRLHDDVLTALVFHVRYMSCIFARELHHGPLRWAELSSYTRATWHELLSSTWDDFKSLYADIPDAQSAWHSGPAASVQQTLTLSHHLLSSFGFEAPGQEFWIRVPQRVWVDRLKRVNDESSD